LYDPNCAFKHRLDAPKRGRSGILSARAAALRKIGRLADALADYDMAIVLEPKHIGGYRYRAYVLSALGRDRNA
jgi:hypothetical protein